MEESRSSRVVVDLIYNFLIGYSSRVISNFSSPRTIGSTIQMGQRQHSPTMLRPPLSATSRQGNNLSLNKFSTSPSNSVGGVFFPPQQPSYMPNSVGSKHNSPHNTQGQAFTFANFGGPGSFTGRDDAGYGYIPDVPPSPNSIARNQGLPYGSSQPQPHGQYYHQGYSS